MRCVVDSNIAIKWAVTEADSERALALFPGPMLAPELLLVECANVLWKKVQLGDLNAAQLQSAIRTLQGLRLHWVAPARFLPRVLELSQRLKHPAYDCFYLAIAEHYRVPLVTADGRFATRCRQPDAQDLAPHIRLLSELPAL